MVHEGDCARTAETLVRLYGDRAEHEARDLWRLLDRTGATHAARFWRRVLVALASLRTGERSLLH